MNNSTEENDFNFLEQSFYNRLKTDLEGLTSLIRVGKNLVEDFECSKSNGHIYFDYDIEAHARHLLF